MDTFSSTWQQSGRWCLDLKAKTGYFFIVFDGDKFVSFYVKLSIIWLKYEEYRVLVKQS